MPCSKTLLKISSLFFSVTSLTAKANDGLDRVTNLLRQRISVNDAEFNRAIVKFVDRVDRLGPNQLLSALHSFGGTFTARSTRGKIATQPGAPSRRRSVNRSRQKQDNRGNSLKRKLTDRFQLPQRRVLTTREHRQVILVIPFLKKTWYTRARNHDSGISVTRYYFHYCVTVETVNCLWEVGLPSS